MTTTASQIATEDLKSYDLTISRRNDTSGEWELFICGGEPCQMADDGTVTLWNLTDFEFDPDELAEWDLVPGAEMLVQVWNGKHEVIASAVKIVPFDA